MSIDYSYAYLTLIILVAFLWAFLFWARKDQRGHQLFMSFLMAPLGLTEYWFYQDYWRPLYFLPTFTIGNSTIGFEDIIFCFFVGGIVAVIYESLFHKRYRAGKRRTRASIIAIAGAFFLFLFFKQTGINTIWASSIAAAIASVILVYVDRDLMADCFMSALLMVTIMVGIYLGWFSLFPDVVSRLWVPSGLSGNQIFGIPIEELVSYASWAMFGGILYEFWINAGRYRSLTLTRSMASARKK